MKIEKFKKEKDNSYTLYFNNHDKIRLYDDIILKYNLLIEKEINDKKLDVIIKDNTNLSAYYTALKYITRKMRTELETTNYLERTYTKEISQKAIQKLKEEGLFNKEVYLKSYINDSILLSDKGPNKIKGELKKLGFNEEEINQHLDKIENEIWLEKVKKQISKKIKSNHQYSINKLKTKLLYDLSNKGFYKWMIEESILNFTFTLDDEIIQKEYKKLFNKLSKKYETPDLEYQIKMRLLQKGFTSEEINNIKKDF